MDAGSLFTWWNAIYSLPLAFVLLFVTITSVVGLLGGVFGGITHIGHGAGAHTDASTHVEAHHDIHHEVDAGVGLHTDADAHLDADADLHADVAAHQHDHGLQHHPGGHEGIGAALVFLGVGQAPLVMVLQVLLLLWGLIGIGLHRAMHVGGPIALLWSLPLTFLLSVLGTRLFASLFGRFFKPIETSVVRDDELVGRLGKVVYPVTADQGTVHVRDQYGTLHRLRARSSHGRLESGQEIIVLGYDPARRLYQVDDSSAFVDR